MTLNSSFRLFGFSPHFEYLILSICNGNGYELTFFYSFLSLSVFIYSFLVNYFFSFSTFLVNRKRRRQRRRRKKMNDRPKKKLTECTTAYAHICWAVTVMIIGLNALISLRNQIGRALAIRIRTEPNSQYSRMQKPIKA